MALQPTVSLALRHSTTSAYQRLPRLFLRAETRAFVLIFSGDTHTYIYNWFMVRKYDERWMNGSRVKTKASVPQRRTQEGLAPRTIGGWEALPEERNIEESTSLVFSGKEFREADHLHLYACTRCRRRCRCFVRVQCSCYLHIYTCM